MDLSFVEEAAGHRARTERRRKFMGYGVSAAVTVTWLIVVTATGLWPRVIDNWVATVTMVFGSFIGGSTPQSSGAVAFPVFTKILHIPAEVARTFALCIQIVGLGVASLIILIRKRPVDLLALAVIIPTALVSFLVSITLFSDRTKPFWPTLLPGPYVKVSFSLLVLCMATIVFLGSRVPLREIRPRIDRTPRAIILMVIAGLLGGFVTAQVGSGADVLFYLVAVVLLGLEPRVGVPTSIPIMAVISLSGLLYLGIGQGMLLTRVADGWVVGFGSQPVPPGQLAAGRFDLFGLWLASVPVVVWFAPLGSAFAAAISTRALAAFVGVLAALEVITTIIFLPQLHTDRALQVYSIVSTIVLLTGLWLANRYRHVIAGTTFDRHQSLSRESVDAVADYAGPPEENREKDR